MREQSITRPWLIYHREPIELASGARSHWEIDGKEMFSDQRIRESVLDFWTESIVKRDFYSLPFLFLGVPTGGMRWAEVIQEKYGPVPAQEEAGTIFIVEDVVTTGRSLLNFRHSLKLASNVPILAVATRGDFRQPIHAWVNFRGLQLVEE